MEYVTFHTPPSTKAAMVQHLNCADRAITNFVKKNTALICSGILDTRLADVTAALEKAGFTIIQTKSKEDWRCIIAKNNAL